MSAIKLDFGPRSPVEKWFPLHVYDKAREIQTDEQTFRTYTVA